MRHLVFSQDFLVIKKHFDDILSNLHEILIWQKTSEERISQIVKIERNLLDHRILWIRSDRLSFSDKFKHGDVYLYAQTKQILFKTKIKEIQKDFFCLYYPNNVLLLSEDPNNTAIDKEALKSIDAMDSNVSLDKIEIAKSIWGSVWKEFAAIEKIGSSDGPVHCPILDLSSGGTSFLFHEENYFKNGETVSFIAINKNNQMMTGSVIKIQPFDEDQGTYRIFIRF